MSPLIRLWRDESAATAVEYSIVIGGIAMLIIAVVYGLGGKVFNLYSNFTQRFNP